MRGKYDNENPHKELLIDGILRKKIINCNFWKTDCYALNAVTFIDKAIKLKYVGGSYGKLGHPTKFACLLLKLLQINPGLDVAIEFLKSEYKYLIIISAFYIRLTCAHLQIYKKLEPLLFDYRKVLIRNKSGEYSVTTIDQLIDQLLINESFCGITLPKLIKREVYETNNLLEKQIFLSTNKASNIMRDSNNIKNDELNLVEIENCDQEKEDSDFDKKLNIKNILEFNKIDQLYEESSDEEVIVEQDDYIEYIKSKRNIDFKIGNENENLKNDKNDGFIEQQQNLEENNNNKSNENDLDYWNSMRAKLGLPLL